MSVMGLRMIGMYTEVVKVSRIALNSLTIPGDPGIEENKEICGEMMPQEPNIDEASHRLIDVSQVHIQEHDHPQRGEQYLVLSLGLWSANAHNQNVKAWVNILNVTKCWICTHIPTGSTQGLVLEALPFNAFMFLMYTVIRPVNGKSLYLPAPPPQKTANIIRLGPWIQNHAAVCLKHSNPSSKAKLEAYEQCDHTWVVNATSYWADWIKCHKAFGKKTDPHPSILCKLFSTMGIVACEKIDADDHSLLSSSYPNWWVLCGRFPYKYLPLF